LFNSEVDNLVSDWTDEELQSYYNTYLEKAGVVAQYKSEKPEETVAFKEPAKKAAKVVDEEEDEFADTTSTATATIEKSEDEFDYATSDLEESSILDDSEFADEDFEIGDGDEL
jgi:hypothetical protein